MSKISRRKTNMEKVRGKLWLRSPCREDLQYPVTFLQVCVGLSFCIRVGILIVCFEKDKTECPNVHFFQQKTLCWKTEMQIFSLFGLLVVWEASGCFVTSLVFAAEKGQSQIIAIRPVYMMLTPHKYMYSV